MTPFGKMLRQERKERGMMLADMARVLGLSSPYLSQLETGVRPLNSRVVEKVIQFLELNQSDAAKMRRAAASSVQASVDTVTIDLSSDLSRLDRELASNLALSFNRLKPETRAKLRELLKDESHG